MLTDKQVKMSLRTLLRAKSVEEIQQVIAEQAQALEQERTEAENLPVFGPVPDPAWPKLKAWLLNNEAPEDVMVAYLRAWSRAEVNDQPGFLAALMELFKCERTRFRHLEGK